VPWPLQRSPLRSIRRDLAHHRVPASLQFRTLSLTRDHPPPRRCILTSVPHVSRFARTPLFFTKTIYS